MNTLFSPVFYESELPPQRGQLTDPRERTNAMLLFTSKLGFVGLKPSGPLRDAEDKPLWPSVKATFYDVGQSPIELILEGSSYACVPGCGHSLRDPAVSIHMLYEAERQLFGLPASEGGNLISKNIA